MGKEKRLLLLAVITVLISTTGYGTIYSKTENVEIGENRLTEINKEKNATFISVSENGSVIIKDKKENNENLEITKKEYREIKNEKGEILANRVLNINTNSTSENINNGILTGEFNLAKGVSIGEKTVFDVVGVQKGTFINNGTITISGSQDFIDSSNKKQTIYGKGINITNAKANVTNEGLIESSNKAIAVNITNGNFINKSQIKVSGKDSIGINQIGGTVINNETGIIEVTNGATGVLISNGKFTNEGKKDGKIEYGIHVSGKDSIGINQIGGTVINNKRIKISKNAIGVKVSNKQKFTNTGIITGIKGIGVVLENGILDNSKEIILTDKNEGIAIKSLSGNNTVKFGENAKVQGKIIGSEGIDIFIFDGKKSENKIYNGLNVESYEVIAVRTGNVKIDNNSRIELEYNKGNKEYQKESYDKLNIDINKERGNLIIGNSTIIINFKDSLSRPIESESPIIDAQKIKFEEGIKFGINSSDGRKEFILNEALGIDSEKIEYDNFDKIFSSTAIWKYKEINKGKIKVSKENYEDALLKSEAKEFAKKLEKTDNNEIKNIVSKLEFVKTREEFTKAIAQLSGGLHGYTVDIAAVNSRTLSNTMRERALTRDYLIKRPVSSWIQDISYIDNNHRFGGLMDVKYNEKGVIGISEKQILSNGKLGLVYGGSSGKADAEDNGNIDVDTAYFGGYYNHEFNDKWSLNSNANFVYTHNRVTRNVKFGEKENEVKENNFKANYPTYTVGMGSSLVYTLKDDLYNKAHFYAGIDVNRIMQGMITEDEDKKFDGAKELAVRKNGAANDKSYYSIVPSAGFMVQNTGYIFDKKYRIGADLNWETEVGNIKDGKRLHMKGITDEYKVGTTERENVFSYSLFGALNLTEDLAVNTKYTSKFSDEYNADMISAGFEYKMDTMGDNGIFGPIFYGIENNKPMSDRWGGTLSLMMETLDDTDRTYYGGGKLNGGDYATSTIYKPKFTLSLNDKKSNLGYYFEGYYQNNKMLQGMKSNEAKMHASRIHGEVRWTDTYSKGKYGINIGYRHEESDKPQNFNQTYYRRTERKVHQLRLTPNFTYELGNGFTFTGKTTGIFEYNYAGDRDSQMDFLMENEYGIVYTGFMPKWRLSLIYFRDDRWYDNSNRKVSWNSKKKEYFYDYNTSGRYQLGQIRPTVIYYFGNGGSFKFDTRIPLGNGQWYDDKKGNKSSGEAYEVRYGFNYYHPVTPGLTMNVGGTFLNIKNKAKNGDITRSYSFRPNIGFSYSF